MNRSGKWKWAAWTVSLGVLLYAVLLVFQARGGFRSNAMLLFPELLLISMMLMDRASYILTASMILMAVASLGLAEGVHLFRAHEPAIDAVLLDMTLPGLSG